MLTMKAESESKKFTCKKKTKRPGSINYNIEINFMMISCNKKPPVSSVNILGKKSLSYQPYQT